MNEYKFKLIFFCKFRKISLIIFVKNSIFKCCFVVIKKNLNILKKKKHQILKMKKIVIRHIIRRIIDEKKLCGETLDRSPDSRIVILIAR